MPQFLLFVVYGRYDAFLSLRSVPMQFRSIPFADRLVLQILLITWHDLVQAPAMLLCGGVQDISCV